MIDHSLDVFRAKERDASAMLALADPTLSELFAVWPLVTTVTIEGAAPETWADLWSSERVQVDVPALSRLLGVSVHDASAALDRAIELRVIYPDGTLHAKIEELMKDKAELWRRRALGQREEIPDTVPEDEQDRDA